MKQIRVTCRTNEDFQNVRAILESGGYEINYEDKSIEEVSFILDTEKRTAKTGKFPSDSYLYCADEFIRDMSGRFCITLAYDRTGNLELFESGSLKGHTSPPLYRAKIAGQKLAEYFEQSCPDYGCDLFIEGAKESKIPKCGDIVRFTDTFIKVSGSYCDERSRSEALEEEYNLLIELFESDKTLNKDDILFRFSLMYFLNDATDDNLKHRRFYVIAANKDFCLISDDRNWSPIYLIATCYIEK